MQFLLDDFSERFQRKLARFLPHSTVALENSSAREDKMPCTDTAKDVNNALHQCGDADAKVITLQYAAYMN